ncbi:MAG: OmpA family protein [Akkermansiaceae bacterium]|jgi:outer membrane protein OmpA-like peptidoglycan-associated protein|nr:OmpA family protein [Akkermansiaceae bacterium]
MRSQLPYLAVALIIGALVTFLILNRRPPAPVPTVPPAVVDRAIKEDAPPKVPEIPELKETEIDQTPTDPLADPGAGQRSANPADLIGSIGEALEKGDLATVGKLIGSTALDEETRARLAAMAAAGPVRLVRPNPVREVGEMELNARTRWALLLDGTEPGRDRIIFDLARDGRTWGIESIILPPPAGTPVPKAAAIDALGISDAFLQAILSQNFELAKEFVDTTRVSDAKIAGLCILFEEGEYLLRNEKPLRAMFQREDAAGFLANVMAGDGSEAAQFSMTLEKTPDATWHLAEINLDELLADYARRVAGGDVYYTPLLKNPKGGDTLVLYFDFDADTLTERTQRQLEIVADLLRLDPGKKLTISGHTDALGTEDYNERLSARRATSVRDFLVSCGVPETQIVTLAKGQSQPRRPNFNEDGGDNPDGRRVNRRSEIYLDF